jgi:hypothetical protein
MFRYYWAGLAFLLLMLPCPRAWAGSVRPMCAPNTDVPQGSAAQVLYRAVNEDSSPHSVRAFPDGDRSWARSPGIVDPLFLAPGDTVSWIVSVPDTAAPGVVRVPFRVLWDGGEDSCTNLIAIEAITSSPGPSTAFSIGITRPHPARRSAPVLVAIALPDAGPATLETLDTAGRRIGRREIPGPGRREVMLDELAHVAPGRYMLVLAQGAHRFTRGVILLP